MMLSKYQAFLLATVVALMTFSLLYHELSKEIRPAYDFVNDNNVMLQSNQFDLSQDANNGQNTLITRVRSLIPIETNDNTVSEDSEDTYSFETGVTQNAFQAFVQSLENIAKNSVKSEFNGEIHKNGDENVLISDQKENVADRTRRTDDSANNPQRPKKGQSGGKQANKKDEQKRVHETVTRVHEHKPVELDPVHPRVAVFSMFIEEKDVFKRLTSNVLTPIKDHILSNHKEYAKLHNYTYIFFESKFDESKVTTYQKPYMFEKLFWDKKYLYDNFNITNTFDYALFIDFDAIFINKNKSIINLYENAINKYNYHNKTYFGTKEAQNDLSIVFAGDIGGIVNAGVLAMKKTEFTRHFLEQWKIAPKNLLWDDQGQFAAMLVGANSGMSYRYWDSLLSGISIYDSNNFFPETMYWSQVFNAYDNWIHRDVRPYVALVAHYELNTQVNFYWNKTYTKHNHTVFDCVDSDNSYNSDNSGNRDENNDYGNDGCNRFIFHAYMSDKIVILSKFLNITNLGDYVDLANRSDIVLEGTTDT